MTSQEFFEVFCEKKNLETKHWEIVVDGTSHFIDSDFIIDLIKQTVGEEAEKAEKILRTIDIRGGDIYHFLLFLAEGYIFARTSTANKLRNIWQQ